jgi:hypothetical protein
LLEEEDPVDLAKELGSWGSYPFAIRVYLGRTLLVGCLAGAWTAKPTRPLAVEAVGRGSPRIELELVILASAASHRFGSFIPHARLRPISGAGILILLRVRSQRSKLKIMKRVVFVGHGIRQIDSREALGRIEI